MYKHCIVDCAIDEYEYQDMVGLMFFCEANGNYAPVQCLGSVCFCADENGDQIADTEPVGIDANLK